MEHHFQAALDPRKQELLEARFIGARVSFQKTKQKTLHIHTRPPRYTTIISFVPFARVALHNILYIFYYLLTYVPLPRYVVFVVVVVVLYSVSTR